MKKLISAMVEDMKKETPQFNNQKPIKKPPFDKETTRSLIELGQILRGIHNRLIGEGYILKDRKYIKPDEEETETSEAGGEKPNANHG